MNDVKKDQTRLKIVTLKMCFKNHIYSTYYFKQDSALNNQQWLICHKTQPNQNFFTFSFTWDQQKQK